MNARPYVSVLTEIAQRRGISFNSLEPKELGTMVTGLNAAMDYAWPYGQGWPEACKVKKFAREIQAETEYTFLSYTQADGVSLETVLGIYLDNPLVTEDPRPVAYKRGEDGLYFPFGGGATEVWVRWRKPAPLFTACLHDASKAYAAGIAVWDGPEGECYRALKAVPANTEITSAEHWQVQAIPDRLAQALIAGAHAISVMAEAQYNTAAILARVMDTHLETKALQLYDESR